MLSKRAHLAAALAEHIRPGMHLNFASTPSRSNAAILQLARAFRATRPDFTLSTTGFHSVMHLPALLRLGKNYISCFFGDNYPIPRPNALYTQLLAEGAQLESWSLLSYVSSLRAGALGQDWAVNRSLAGTTLGLDLGRAGRYREIDPPHGLVTALRPDVCFLHALVGDTEGRALFSPPHSEAFWGALGARRGVILTVEKLVDRAAVEQHRDAIKIPPERVLAICEEPFGAHPQPLFALPRFELPGYRDDFDHYALWRQLTQDKTALAYFEAQVLDGPAEDLSARYRTFVGAAHLQQLAEDAAALQADKSPPPRQQWQRPAPLREQVPTAESFRAASRENEILLLLAARKIIERVLDGGYHTILAGIGHGFMASRLAKLQLLERGVDVKVMVETGLYDLECGPRANDFLLSYDNIAYAKKLSSVEDVLGTLTCGADNRCLGVLGAAQIDPRGDINTTRLSTGTMLVGSGGGNDIAANAAEVIVLSRHSASRLVERVDHITSIGRRVSTIVTNLCALRRKGRDWLLTDVYPAFGGAPITTVLEAIQKGCPWNYRIPERPEYAPLLSTAEIRLLHTLDRHDNHSERKESE